MKMLDDIQTPERAEEWLKKSWRRKRKSWGSVIVFTKGGFARADYA